MESWWCLPCVDGAQVMQVALLVCKGLQMPQSATYLHGGHHGRHVRVLLDDGLAKLLRHLHEVLVLCMSAGKEGNLNDQRHHVRPDAVHLLLCCCA